jgi:hypothetical protein
VLCGSLLPSQLSALPARKLIGPIRFCTLDCPDAVLASRLHSRPSWRGTSSETAIADATYASAGVHSGKMTVADPVSVTIDLTTLL